MNSYPSIVIPTCNEAGYLDGLLKSIKNFLSIKVEIIVVSNGSVDNTKEVCDSHGVILLEYEDRMFPSAARNAGAKAASGDLLVFLDSDITVTQRWADQLRSHHLALKNKGDHLTGDHYQMSKAESLFEKYWFSLIRSRKSNYINGGNLIVPAETFSKIGGFNSELETGEDFEFCVRAIELGIPVYTNEEWYAHHEGFPKTVSSFVRRESWHGKGDFSSLNNVFASKIAVATFIFLLMHIILIISLIIYVVSGWFNYALLGGVSLIGVAGVCLSHVIIKIKPSIAKIPFVLFVSYLYFVGRSYSIYRAIFKI